MRKTAKVPKKAVSHRKAAQNSRKNGVKTVKTPRKRRKTGKSDVLKAFLLAGVLVVLSAGISFGIIVREEGRREREEGVAEKITGSGEEETAARDATSTSRTTTVATDATSSTRTTTVGTSATAATRTTTAARDATSATRTTTVTTNATPAARTTTVATDATSATRTTPAATSATSATRTTSAGGNATSVTRTLPAAAQKPQEKAVVGLGTLVFVIDDAGNNLRELEPFLRIPGPLTIAVLPGLPNSAEAARRIRAAGKEVFLHQPMEALGAQNPGPGAIYSGMSAVEIRAVLARNIAEIGPVAGMNNHQGSKVTMDRAAVETILAFCAENNLLFLDSRTTAETVVPDVARQMGMKIGERNVFLDNEQDRESMLRYISTGLTRSAKNGSAVMIGHTWSPDLAPLLAEQFPFFIRQGYTIKTASDIIR